MHPPPPPPPPPSSHSYPSLPILAISVIGILTTAVLLLTYYLFITKCCRHLHLLFRLSPSPHGRRPSQFNHPTAAVLTQPRGLDPPTINSIPTFRFSTGAHSGSRSVECAVCLAEFRENDLLRLLPNCSHSFHVDCIDTWLQSNPNCPLCRDKITPLPIQQYYLNTTTQPIEGNHSSSIEVREGSPIEESTTTTTTSSTTPGPTKMIRRFWKMGSMGDEWIDTMREKDERFVVDQPIRRSFSMDSSNDRQLYVSVQEILRQNPSLLRNGEGSSGGGGGGRLRRSFFSFGWSSRSASVALPVARSEL